MTRFSLALVRVTGLCPDLVPAAREVAYASSENMPPFSA